jgi:hypothetical protein
MLTREQLSALLDTSGQLLGDNNFKARARAAGRVAAVSAARFGVLSQTPSDAARPRRSATPL